MKSVCFPALVVGAMLCANSAFAQTATGEMGVSAQVTRNCTLTSAPLDFDSLSILAVNSSSAVVTLIYNGTSTVTTILVGMGATAAPATQRNMISGENTIPYTLHLLETGGADIATEGAVTLVQQGTTNTYSLTLYGKVQPSAGYQIGSYSDTVVLTAAYTGP